MGFGATAGYEAHDSVTLNEFLFDTDPKTYSYQPGGITLDGTNGIDGGNTNTYDLRAGWLLGQITTTGLFVPCKRTTTTTTGTVTAAVLVNSYAFKVGDTITIGSDTDIEITAIDYTTHTITIASTAISSGDAVFAQDGSQTCRGILGDFRRLRNLDNTAAANKHAQLLITGKVNTAGLYGDFAAIQAASGQFLEHIQFFTNGVQVAS